MLVCALKQTAGNSSERWFKGNTHTHTLWSDGNDFPETAADWYKSKGYDFLVLSDHNVPRFVYFLAMEITNRRF
ncbi:MAG: hypothetical protein VX839_00950, partial [Verrucomicrobiota bacterium]|nr:hypothetical protein [Verrucomicrobiota bacterium]